MKLVDLFCGSGGFSLGAHSSGFEVAAAYDIDKILTSSFPKNFPNTELFHRDVATLSGNEIRAAVADDITGIFGGPPCQGFSDIGRRSSNDPRRELLGHFFRIVSEIEPYFFVMENVRGLAYVDALPVLEGALALVLPRYDVLGPLIWDASDFGAATKRNRMFVIGVRKDLKAPINRQAVEKFKRPAATVKAAISDLACARMLPSCDSFPGFDRWTITRRGLPSDYALPLRSDDMTFTGHRPTVHSQAVIDRFALVKPGAVDPIGRHSRLKWDGQCPTLRAGTGADKGSYQAVRPIHPAENRVITVREAARLQGFPDAHIFHPTVWHSFRMIGNSVSPIMSAAIFKAIRAHLGLFSANFGDNANTGTNKADLSEVFFVAAE
ncbi:DNA cytosine methyltransferase [Aurantimonas marina]|uniref:DNA cytosine methyltransferase n=1 Tax=Aurantimonas marina TaxID=2780508 RepID=UPI0019D30226|nr:DNA cytosine methyltransferase [Aurantimonas marina]